MKNKYTKKMLLVEILMIIAVFIIFYPIIMIVGMSLKNDTNILVSPLSFPVELNFENYVIAFKTMDYLRAFWNSLLLTSLTVLIGVMLFTLAAYGVARAKKGKKLFNIIFYIMLMGLMIPPQVTLVPMVVWLKALKMINTIQGLIGVMVGGGVAFGIFMMKGFIGTIPAALEEAATIDGCTPFGVFFKIVLPLLKPSIATLVIINTIGTWNDFMHPLLLLQGKASRTIPLAVFFFRGEYNTQWNILFAGLVLSILPVLIFYFILQDQIISGLTSGGVKA